METYVTPYDRGKALLAEFVTFTESQQYAIPGKRYVQIGDIVRDCEATIVAVGSLVPSVSYDPVTCVAPRNATFLVEIIRNCAVVFDNNALTVPASLEEVSAVGARDGQMLYDFAAQVDGWSDKQPWSVVWSLAEGGLQVASLQLTIGIP